MYLLHEIVPNLVFQIFAFWLAKKFNFQFNFSGRDGSIPSSKPEDTKAQENSQLQGCHKADYALCHAEL